jgi:cyclophilin family peptidyl-prolyl cis-trans isomerase
VTTERGTFRIRLFPFEAPFTVRHFLALVRRGFYDGLAFHRVVPGFVAQGGDPRGDGSGGPGYSLRCEIGRRRYLAGGVGMALSGKDTGGSQFFVTLAPQPHLDGRYTLFGQVFEGLDAVLGLVEGDRMLKVELETP